MELYGLSAVMHHTPELDREFFPLGLFNRAFLQTAHQPVSIALERADGQIAAVQTFLHGTGDMAEADRYYVDRLVKTLLWMKGGFRIYTDDVSVYDYLNTAYCEGGARQFDRQFMSDVYEHSFEVVLTDAVPESRDITEQIGGHSEGCRIGFDAGGSDRKVSAVIDGETVYSEEVVWFPKENADPDYHYGEIVTALKTAAAHLPRVDAVGISSAGIYINNRTMVASLFTKIPHKLYGYKVKNIYERAVRDTFGDIPLRVINDGDVTALAGAMSTGENSVLGIAMGTSEAGGFVDEQGRITGWLNELAFVPVAANGDAPRDEWSGDIGCGASYFSQDGVIRLAGRAGILWEDDLTPAEKLKEVQSLAEAGDPRAEAVFRTIGVHLGHTLGYYHDLYGCAHVLLLGRVMSGQGGDMILKLCHQVLKEDYPALCERMTVSLPNEAFRRVGQSVAAAGLPKI